jgi:hypothetical protein
LAAEILRCNNDHELLAGLAHLHVYGLIRACTSSTIIYLLSCQHSTVYNSETEMPIASSEQNPRMSPQRAAAELERLLEKPSITAEELRKLVNLPLSTA